MPFVNNREHHRIKSVVTRRVMILWLGLLDGVGFFVSFRVTYLAIAIVTLARNVSTMCD